MPAEPIAEQREDGGLVESRKALDPIAVVASNQRCVIGKPACTIPIGPSAAIIERLREVPMIETNPRFDAGTQQRINQAIVEGEPRLVNNAAAGREDARPGD